MIHSQVALQCQKQMKICDFAVKGAECSVLPDVKEVIQQFHGCKKPIGLTCIAPILAARILCGVNITLGQNSCDEEKWPYRDAIKAAEQMGAIVENKVSGQAALFLINYK
ncbi:hypothetical protein J6590_057429 [Homalodisca vitripennis]|nr:hypothetical protein J6590_057429 [Homalodisca vitripennis]